MFRITAAALVACVSATAAFADVPANPGQPWEDRAAAAFAGASKPTFFLTRDGKIFAANYLIGNAQMSVTVSTDSPQTVNYVKQ